jgi:hypothetical protein
MVHRRVDEECGKRKKPWIPELRRLAEFHVNEMPVETFSSSKGESFNKSMKERALKEILPSLFNVAEAHEDYIAQYDLYEGSGKTDPGNGKYVNWTRTTRPRRTGSKKFRRRAKPVKAVSREKSVAEDSSEETEIDEPTSNPSASLGDPSNVNVNVDHKPSFAIPQLPPQSSPTTVRAHDQIPSHPESSQSDIVPPPRSSFQQSIDSFHLGDRSEMDTKPQCHCQMAQLPHIQTSYGNAEFQSLQSMADAGSMPISTTMMMDSNPNPLSFQRSQNVFFASSQKNLEALASVTPTCSLREVQSSYPQVELPFGSYTYGTEDASGAMGTLGVNMLPYDAVCHALPMDYHG